jgi:UDP-glucuronate 4-epimerase|tara:strand:+ start:2499 stop:3470 length:972 start_codon:yes stop_codon:yes gene_type:complete
LAILITGVAGFIGMNVARSLLERGELVIGVDNLNDYYDVNLKKARVSLLAKYKNFRFEFLDISEPKSLNRFAGETDKIIHLAAQAGVRYSFKNPDSYIKSNLAGHLNILEYARYISNELINIVYASSSSVYGASKNLPYSVSDSVDNPVSLYAATKRAGELMSEVYSHNYNLSQIGLRLFTVYGPWGRPDMSAYIFTSKIFSGEPIQVFGDGQMRRDFTFIDDIVTGIVSALDRPHNRKSSNHEIYNLGNNKPEPLLRYIGLFESALNKKAIIEFEPMQAGDMKETYADIDSSRNDLGFKPITSIDEGIPRFVNWFLQFHNLK